jgi:hypothetical protein
MTSRIFVLLTLAMFIGCNSNGNSPVDPDGQGGSGFGGSGGEGVGGKGAGGEGVGGKGAGGEGVGGASSESTLDEYGFMRRRPETRQVTCSKYPSEASAKPQKLEDTDYICTFAYKDNTATLYFQNTVNSCIYIMSAQPRFKSRGWITQGGQVTELSDVTYDWGGNHHNDSVDFKLGDRNFRYYHSSFGFGWRACQNLDCIQIVDKDGTVLEDGCEPTRSLPITCVQIDSKGKADELKDTFAVCPGDSD